MKNNNHKRKKAKYNSKEGHVVVNSVRMVTSYGPFKHGSNYKVLATGRDWVRSTCGGKPYYIPLAFVDINPEEELEDLGYDDSF